MRTLNKLILEWAKDKGILENGTPIAQCEKTYEEVNELRCALDTDNKAEIIDALGDIYVTILIQAEMQGVKLEDCIASAYNIISKRTGKMIDGQFVKD